MSINCPLNLLIITEFSTAWIIKISMMGASAIVYSAKKETHNGLFSQLYSVYFKLIFYSNTLVYWANISLTNVIHNTEQRIEK